MNRSLIWNQVPIESGGPVSALSARLFGFQRAIAHGMWTKAHCLAALEGRLPEAVTVDVRFKKPLLIPGRVEFSAHEGASGWEFGVWGKGPHLVGSAQDLTP